MDGDLIVLFMNTVIEVFYDVSYNQNTYKLLTSFECCDFLNVCLKYPFLRLRTSLPGLPPYIPPTPVPWVGMII